MDTAWPALLLQNDQTSAERSGDVHEAIDNFHEPDGDLSLILRKGDHVHYYYYYYIHICDASRRVAQVHLFISSAFAALVHCDRRSSAGGGPSYVIAIS